MLLPWTDKGDLNRWIKRTNNLLQSIRRKIAVLTDWIRAAKEKMDKPQVSNLVDLLNAYYTARNAGAWSSKAKVGNLKHFVAAINYLSEKGIATLEDLEGHLAAQRDKTGAVNSSMKAMSARKKELETLLHYAGLHWGTKPVYDEWTGIKWKGKREKFAAEHERELNLFHMACRKVEKHLSPTSEIPVQKWRLELAEIRQKYQTEYERYKPMRDDLMKLLQVKNCVDTALNQKNKQQIEVRRDQNGR